MKKKYLREISKCCSLNKELGNSQLVIYTWGNVSILSKNRKYVFIKPSGIPFKDLLRRHISIID